MAYIGRDTDKISNVEVLDNITFDGSSSYTLQKNSVNFTPSSANTLLVSIDGVVQAGNFTVSGSTIDFGTAVAGTSTCDFILHYGVGLITTVSDGTVTTAKLADSAVTAAKITDATITAAKLASGTVQNQSAFKNIIINGDMSIAQRGTSFSSISSGSANFGVDRFNVEVSSLGTWTISQETDVPTGQGFAKSLKLDCTTADASPSADDLIVLTQSIEGQNLQYLKKGTSNAESITLSFWVKSNKTGTYIAELRDVDNNRTINKSYTINSSNTWEKKTIIYDGDTTGTLDNDNGKSFQLNFWLGGGSNWTSGTLQTSWGSNTLANRQVGQVNLADSTSNEWYITGVQLEAGTTASDFEFLPYDVNLSRCQRYYQLWTEGNNKEVDIGFYFTSSSVRWVSSFYKQMRTVPSLVTVSGTDYYGIYKDGALDTFNDFNGINDTSTNQNFQVYATSGDVSGTAGHAGMLRTNNASASIAFNAEL